MKNDDLKKAPKLFAENIKIGFTPEYFVCGISSGSQAHIFALSPAHAKRFKQYLEYEINEYEKQHSEIVAKWDPSVISPVQRTNPPGETS